MTKADQIAQEIVRKFNDWTGREPSSAVGDRRGFIHILAGDEHMMFSLTGGVIYRDYTGRGVLVVCG